MKTYLLYDKQMDIINKTTQKLSAAGIPTARIDALALLAHTANTNAANVVAGNFDLSPSEMKKLNELVGRRAAQEPLAYVLGCKEFYGRSFLVNKHTLIPRPESEHMISLALQLDLPLGGSVIDIGTGCGVLGITYWLELTKQHSTDKTDEATGLGSTTSSTWLELTDLSDRAMSLAKRNARTYSVNAQYLQQDFRQMGSLDRYDLVLANLPYVPVDQRNKLESNTPGLAYEPDLALYVNNDGLDLYRDLLGKSCRTGTYIIVEALEDQHPSLIQLAAANMFGLHSSDNLALCLKKM